MKSVDPTGLGHRILELLRVTSESVLSLELCRDGSVRISKEAKA